MAAFLPEIKFRISQRIRPAREHIGPVPVSRQVKAKRAALTDRPDSIAKGCVITSQDAH